uniref:putative WEB family protein At1g65010, chloroplastic n=1 Tax=Erigeron canadensis TaxID=72917 RepID=UPI001CB95E75|nr:putative WEB family protein At1g65010, chloroplastic [Erigeron canadensis]
MLRSKSRSGYLEFGHKKHSSFLIRSISGSKICRGDGLTSQVDKEAVVSVDRKSISLSENRIVKEAMMQKQMSNLEEELKSTKHRLDEVENERNRMTAELKEAKELANAGLSAKKAEEVFSELKGLKDSLLSSRKEIESRDKEISSLSSRLESAKVFEAKVAEKDVDLEKLKKKIRELENEVEKTKQSEEHMLDSLMLQTRQIEQTKMDLEESKLEVMTLQETVENLQRGGRNGPRQAMVAQKGNVDTSQETKALKDEIKMLKTELKLATEAEEKAKKAMDDLASALREVATESSTANEKLRQAEEQVTHLKQEVDRLKEDLELQTETSERLRVEAEESVLAWTSKEMGFISCIKKADEENASYKHENNKLREALLSAETTVRIKREESDKLRDILKQALNESNVAKEASNIARAENSELKDLLAEKEESLHFLTKENERLRINEVAARENVKEFKRLLAAKEQANKLYDDKDQTDVFNSPVASLYEEHIDGRITPQQAFSFDFDDLKGFNKEEEYYHVLDGEDDNVSEIVVNDDPEKAEALKGSIFDTTASPKSEPHTPKANAQHRRAATGFTESSGSGQSEEVESFVHSSSYSHEDGDNKGYMYSLYSKKKLFRKIGELIIGKNNSKKDGLPEHGEEQVKDQGKEHIKEQGKDQSKEQGKEQAN